MRSGARAFALVGLLCSCNPTPHLRLEPVEGTLGPPVVIALEPVDPDPGAIAASLLPLRLVLGNRSFSSIDLSRPLTIILRDRDGEVARAVPPEEAVDAIVVAGKATGTAAELLSRTFHGPIAAGDIHSGIIYLHVRGGPLAAMTGLLVDVRLVDDMGADQLLEARLSGR